MRVNLFGLGNPVWSSRPIRMFNEIITSNKGGHSFGSGRGGRRDGRGWMHAMKDCYGRTYITLIFTIMVGD